MHKSDNIELLAGALVKAHAEIDGVAKKANNPFFKSKYADLASVVDAVKPALLKQGIVIVQGVQDAPDGVAVETMLLHNSGQWISSTLRLPASKQDAQGYGSATTYGRRYGLMAICGVPAEDDDGNAASASPKAGNDVPTPNHKPVTKEVWDTLTTDEQTWLQDIADSVRMVLQTKGGPAAVATIEEQGLSADHKVALWSRFDSKERTAMKKKEAA